MTSETVNGAYRQQQHDWQDPPPGQGRLQMCSKCGKRKSSVMTQEQACTGGASREAVMHGRGNQDYDPFAD